MNQSWSARFNFLGRIIANLSWSRTRAKFC